MISIEVALGFKLSICVLVLNLTDILLCNKLIVCYSASAIVICHLSLSLSLSKHVETIDKNPRHQILQPPYKPVLRQQIKTIVRLN